MSVRPLHRLMLVQSELMARGYGRLRFYSYIKEGLGAMRVFWFALHADQPADRQSTAHDPRLMLSTHDFDRVSFMATEAAVDEPIVAIVDALAPRWTSAIGQSDPAYLAWHEAMLAVCGSDAFPVTEEPEQAGFGENGEWCEIVVARDVSAEELAARVPAFAVWDKCQGLLIPRPPRFAVEFPEREARQAAWRAEAEAEARRVATNKLKWRQRVAAIDAQIAARKPSTLALGLSCCASS